MTEFLDLSKGMFNQSGFLDLSAKGINLYQPQGNRYKGYSFYVDFADGIGLDRVSKTLMKTTLSTGRVNADGTALGANAPAIQDGKLNTLGPIPLLNGMTDDVINAYWAGGIGRLSPNAVKATALGQAIYKAISTTENVLYTLSFYAYVESDGNLQNYGFYHHGSTASYTTVPGGLTYERKRYSVTVLGKVGGGSIDFGLRDGNASNWATVYIDTINITQSAYLLPPVHNATTNPITTPHNYSDADEGYKWPFASCPKLFGSFDGKGDSIELAIPIDAKSTAEMTNVTSNSFSFINTTGAATGHRILNILSIGTYYEVSITLIGSISHIQFGGAIISAVGLSSGTYVVRGVCTIDTNLRFVSSTLGMSGTVQISHVKAVSPAQGTLDVELTPQFSAANVPLMPDIPRTLTVFVGTPTITGSVINFLNESSSVQQLNYWVIGKTYRIVCTVTNFIGTGAILLPYDGTNSNRTISSNGVYSFDYSPHSSTKMVVYSYAGHTATVTINSIQEIPQLNILSANGDFTTPLYYEPVDQLIKLTDGTNTASVAYTAVADTPCAIKIKYGPHPGYANALKMQVSCGAVDGAITAFDGSFNPVTALAPGWDSATDVWQQLSRIAVKEANPWIV